MLHDFPRVKGPLQQEHSSQEEDMMVPFSIGDQEKGSLNDEVFSIYEEKEEKELERSSSAVTTRGDLLLLGDGGEAIASTRRALVSLQEAPRDLTHEENEQHVSMMIENKKKQGRECVPTLYRVLGTHTMIDQSFVIKTLDTKEMLGAHELTTSKGSSLDYENLQKVGEEE